MVDILEAQNLTNPEAVEKPHVIVHTISLPIKNARDFILQRDGYDRNYNIGKEVEHKLREKYTTTFPEDDLDEIIGRVTNESKPGEITGDITRDSLLIPLHAMNSKGWIFRWFKDKSYEKSVDFPSIMDNLNNIGVETPGEDRYDYLTGDNPYEWHNVGHPDNTKQTSYLLMFPSDGVYRKDNSNYLVRQSKAEVHPNTFIHEGAPALNERQKYLVQVTWE